MAERRSHKRRAHRNDRRIGVTVAIVAVIKPRESYAITYNEEQHYYLRRGAVIAPWGEAILAPTRSQYAQGCKRKRRLD